MSIAVGLQSCAKVAANRGILKRRNGVPSAAGLMSGVVRVNVDGKS